MSDVDQVAAVGNHYVGLDAAGGNQRVAAAVDLEDGNAFQRRRVPSGESLAESSA